MNEIAPDRYVYYPGTEVLAGDEVRVIACGTCMPDQRREQASACFVFEFGNGEKMIFDIGSGSMRNINSLMIPAEYLTLSKVALLISRTLSMRCTNGPTTSTEQTLSPR